MLTNAQLTSIGFSFILNKLEPCSPYGNELARKPHFYTVSEHEKLIAELNNVERLYRLLTDKPHCFVAIERILMQFKDVRRSVARSREFTLTDVELFEIKRFLIGLERLAPAYAELTGDRALYNVEISTFTEALDIIDPDGMRALTFRVSDKCSEEIASIRAERRRVDLALRTASREEAERLTAERSLLVAKEENEEAKLRTIITKELSHFADGIERVIGCIARLDFAMAKSRLMKKFSGVIPTINEDSDELHVQGMMNPRTDEVLHEKGRAFTPLGITLKKGSTVITGANMGGKSVAVKTLSLNVMLALCAMPVFCTEAVVPHFADIHLLCDDMENSLSGLSSFGGEMVRFDEILRSRNNGLALVMLDEFARGTNPHEGAALVRAAVRYFNEDGNFTALITTHFDDVARYANLHYQVMGLKDADRNELMAALSTGGERRVKALEGFMDYGLYPVDKDVNPPRDAITICRALNVSSRFMELVEH